MQLDQAYSDCFDKPIRERICRLCFSQKLCEFVGMLLETNSLGRNSYRIKINILSADFLMKWGLALRQIFYRPKSKKLSKNFDWLSLLVLLALAVATCSWRNRNVRQMPIADEIIDVMKKKSSVRTITFPPNLLFKLAVTVIKLEISNGNVNNFNILKNISPG